MYKDDLIELLVSSAVLVFVFLVGLKIMFARRKSKPGSSGGLDDVPKLPLSQLQKQGVLTPEESARVAEAMKRAYLGERKPDGPEAGRTPAPLGDRAPIPTPPSEDMPQRRTPMPVPATEPMDRSPKPKLPERLRHLLDASPEDLEQLRQAGFLSEEDSATLDRFLNHERRR